MPRHRRRLQSPRTHTDRLWELGRKNVLTFVRFWNREMIHRRDECLGGGINSLHCGVPVSPREKAEGFAGTYKAWHNLATPLTSDLSINPSVISYCSGFSNTLWSWNTCGMYTCLDALYLLFPPWNAFPQVTCLLLSWHSFAPLSPPWGFPSSLSLSVQPWPGTCCPRPPSFIYFLHSTCHLLRCYKIYLFTSSLVCLPLTEK